MRPDAAVLALAQEAGLEVDWGDAKGNRHVVGIETLKAVLAALELPANSQGDVADSRSRLRREQEKRPGMVFARAGGEVVVEDASGSAEIESESGERKNMRLRKTRKGRSFFRCPRECGYYRVALGSNETV